MPENKEDNPLVEGLQYQEVVLPALLRKLADGFENKDSGINLQKATDVVIYEACERRKKMLVLKYFEPSKTVTLKG